MSALLCTAVGTSTVVENIFESRFRHLAEMERMGARVRIYEQTAVIEGVPQLHGAAVEATDLRAGAALVIAGLMAQGTTEIYNTHLSTAAMSIWKKSSTALARKSRGQGTKLEAYKKRSPAEMRGTFSLYAQRCARRSSLDSYSCVAGGALINIGSG